MLPHLQGWVAELLHLKACHKGCVKWFVVYFINAEVKG